MRVTDKPSTRDARKLEALVRNRRFSEGLGTFDVEYGEDADGDPVVWIWFDHQAEPGASQARIRELSEFMQSIQQDVLHSGTPCFPHVSLRPSRR